MKQVTVIKKIFTISTDVFLFTFLLIILAVPILVSFNLDPQLYVAENSDVAGASDSVTKKDFSVQETTVTSPRITITKTSQTSNTYMATFTVSGGDVLEETVQFGTLEYNGSQPKIYNIRIRSITNSLDSVYVTAQGDVRNVLSNGRSLSDLQIEFKPNTYTPLSLDISSSIPINYPIEIEYEVSEVY